MQRIKKGEYRYIKSQKKWAAAKTALLFLVSLSLYLSGYITTGSNKNLLTIVAVLGCLPASKSAVNLIMYLRAKGCGEELRGKVAAHAGTLPALYDCVLTTYEASYEIPHMVFRGNNLIGIALDPKCRTASVEKHLSEMCGRNGIKDVNVKIFTDITKYLNRLVQLQELGCEDTQTEAVLALVKALSI